MKFLLDQSAEARIAIFLKSLGHDATRVARDYPAGLPDDQVLSLAVSDDRVLITNDRDFGELIFKHKQPHRGVIFFRFPEDKGAKERITALKSLLSTHANDLNKYLTVSPRGVRIRK